MPKGHKKEGNIVKIQVEAKQPNKKRTTTHKHVAALPKGLLENFVALQRVQANLAEKLDALTKQISELLNLFESTAKSFSENPAVLTSERDKEFIDKINQLLEQDKVIAKGVVYIEDRVNEIEKAVVHAAPVQQPYMPQVPGVPMAPTGEMAGEYQESSSQTPKPLPRV
jgi:hypothetical protein